MHKYARTHKKVTQVWTETHTSAATEGFIPGLLESGISMALGGVSMAIPCTEMKRGRPRLGPRNGDKFTSQAGRLKSLPLVVSFLLLCNGLGIPTHKHTHTREKNIHAFSTNTLSCLLTQCHTIFLKILRSSVHSFPLILKPSCWDVFLFLFFLIFLYFSLTRRNPASLHQD